MSISEKEWSQLAAERGLDPATGSKYKPPEHEFYMPEQPWTNDDIKSIRATLKGIRYSLGQITLILVLGFTALALIGILK